MAAYNVELIRGPLGLFAKSCGQIASGERLPLAEEPVWIDLSLDGEILSIMAADSFTSVRDFYPPFLR